MFAGTKITMNDVEYIVPPISLGQLRNGVLTKLQDHDIMVSQGKPYEAMALRGEIILEALKRNYPDFEEQILYDNLDVGNISAIWMAVLGLSGFTPGEAPAVTATGNGT